MTLIAVSPRAPEVAAVPLDTISTDRATTAVMVCREWAEDHWEAVGMIGSLLTALTVATILAVAFNVVCTGS